MYTIILNLGQPAHDKLALDILRRHTATLLRCKVLQCYGLEPNFLPQCRKRYI